MSETMMFVLGILAGLLLVAVIYAVTRKRKCSEGYDERQTIARLIAFRTAFWTLVAYLLLNGLFESIVDMRWGDFIVESFIGICIATTVFTVQCIFHDAYFSFNEKRSFYLWLFCLAAVVNGILAARSLFHSEMFTDGLLNFNIMNLVVFVMFVILFIALLIKAGIDRHAKAE